MTVDQRASSPPGSSDPVGVIARSPVFRSADPSSLEDLRPVLDWIFLDRNEVLDLGGEHGSALYVVADGRLEICLDTKGQRGGVSHDSLVVASIGAGDIVGEERALAGQRGEMTVRAVTAASLVRLGKEGFDQFLAVHHGVAEALQEAVTPRFHHRRMLMVLNKMFGDLTQDMVADIEARASWHHVPREGILFWQGESSDSVFVVVSGRLQVLSATEGRDPKVVEEIGVGGAAGVLGVLSDDVQTTSVFAVRDSVVLEIPGNDFRELGTRYPVLNRWLVSLLSRRLREVTRGIATERQTTNIVFVPASDGVRLEKAARGVARSLAGEAKCLLLTNAEVDRLIGVTGIAQSVEGSPEDLRLQAWLQQQESNYEYVIYVADSAVTNWSNRCIRQADEVVAIGDSLRPSDETAVETRVRIEQRSRRARMRTALILLHPAARDMPHGTKKWLNQRDVDRYFHVRDDHLGDAARIARYLLGRERALVLSGGGARGFAHAGAIRAIRELGLDLDVIIGVSMGAFIGGRHALAGDTSRQLPRIKERFLRAFGDYTLPMVSLVRGRRFDSIMKDAFDDARIEDLWTPFYCVASNLTRADEVVYASGRMWRKIRASSGLPGLVPPVNDADDFIFDGALINNLPVDLARTVVHDGPIIAIDVVPPVDLSFRASAVRDISGWRIALSRLNPFSRGDSVPDIVSILQRAGQLPSIHRRRVKAPDTIADLYITPPVGNFKILDFSVAEKAAEIGYAHSKKEIAAWLKREVNEGL